MPTDGGDDEHLPAAEGDAPAEPAREHAEEIPRHTRPFRAWGAAQERQAPSLWERVAGWFGGKGKGRPAQPESFGERPAQWEVESRPPVTGRTSFDDLDAPWNDDPFPVAERRSSRPSAERPSLEAFEATWDGSYDAEEAVSAMPESVAEPEPAAEEPVIPEPVAEIPEADPSPEIVSAAKVDEDTDPLWDTPVVAESTAPAPQAFDTDDLDDVWTPPADELAHPDERQPEPGAESALPAAAAPKPGFFARLFGRKPKVEDSLAAQERAAASEWAIEIAEAEAKYPSSLEPADADFADDPAAATAPSDDDFVSDDFAAAAPVATPPSIDDFAEPASLAPADDIEVEVEVDMDEEGPTTAAEPVEEISASASAVDEEPVAGIGEALSDAIVEEPFAAMEEAPAVEPEPQSPEKRPSFIGRLFGRRTPKPAPPAQPSPSIEHSAEDAANLAALLGPITPVEEVVEDAPTELIVSATEVIEEIPDISEYAESTDQADQSDLPLVEELEELAETVGQADQADLSDPRVDEPPLVEEMVVVEETIDVSAADVLPVAEPTEKPGFFSSLLKRISRSQFIPRISKEPVPVVEEETPSEDAWPAAAPVEEEVAPAMEIAAFEETVESAPVAEAEPAADLAAEWGPPPAAELDALFDEPMAPAAGSLPDVPVDVPPPPSPAELDSTQPFPAFRDARDDFADEEPAAADSGRVTEQVDIPVFDEGEKTDEFAVVPAAEAAVAATAAAPVGFWGRLLGRKPEVTGETAPDAQQAAAAADAKLPFVLAKFRTFYNEIIRDKHQKSDVISGFATAIVSAAPSEMADPEFAAQLLSKRLSEMLELQAAESNWTGGDAAKYYPEAQYAMVALADETFATMDWPGRPSWHKHMLEPRMYGTRGADIEFFKRIDKLLKDNPNPEKGARDLARVYLLVIASGFRGKFRQPNVKRPLAEYRRRLYEFSHRADPLELYARDRRIFPEAVEHTLASRAVGRFTSRQRWIAAVLVLLVLYLGISHYAWSRMTVELKDVMSRIETIGANPGRTP